MKPESTFPAVTLADLDALLEFMHGFQRDDPWSVPFHDSDVREVLKELLGNVSLGRAFFISIGNRRVGYMILGFDFSVEFGGRTAWLDELYVEPGMRKRGLGEAALEFASRMAREHGAKVLNLQVNEDNPAIRLYRRCGFRQHERHLLTRWLNEQK